MKAIQRCLLNTGLAAAALTVCLPAEAATYRGEFRFDTPTLLLGTRISGSFTYQDTGPEVSITLGSSEFKGIQVDDFKVDLLFANGSTGTLQSADFDFEQRPVWSSQNPFRPRLFGRGTIQGFLGNTEISLGEVHLFRVVTFDDRLVDTTGLTGAIYTVEKVDDPSVKVPEPSVLFGLSLVALLGIGRQGFVTKSPDRQGSSS